MGCTLRRLVTKVAGFRVRDEMGALLAPRQLGYGVRGGVEAAVTLPGGPAAPVRPEVGLHESLQHPTQRQNTSGCAELSARSAPFCLLVLLVIFFPLLE